ncbi:hypothetical protein [Sphingobacterium faecium]|uniref:hypothetical protein n=1 Tax=Sphingobacterium faecium TaxID=34087 RepID=UPI0024787BE7|nr:hypothetical protein [Sphingobacterium faecium]WGQ12899.1 hypothetical protein QG727_12770 [Sphingobacterium faecium]
MRHKIGANKRCPPRVHFLHFMHFKRDKSGFQSQNTTFDYIKVFLLMHTRASKTTGPELSGVVLKKKAVSDTRYAPLLDRFISIQATTNRKDKLNHSRYCKRAKRSMITRKITIESARLCLQF